VPLGWVILPKALPLGYDMLPFQGVYGIFIFFPKALPLGWVILPFQGVNGILFFFNPRRCRWAGLYCPFRAYMEFFYFYTQGGAIGLGYVALSGRGIPNMNFFALKGQHTLAQRQRLGLIKRHPPHFPP